jgi:hypothetical protein
LSLLSRCSGYLPGFASSIRAVGSVESAIAVCERAFDRPGTRRDHRIRQEKIYKSIVSASRT